MKTPAATRSGFERLRVSAQYFTVVATLALLPAAAHSSEGLEDTVADILTWIVLIVAPIVGIAVFLLIHILPEKIAEKKNHPQVAAIQTLCLLSLVFGGMLWPLAWLWAYSKPVLYRIAYGTDQGNHGGDPGDGPAAGDGAAELARLRERVAELEARGADRAPTVDALGG